MNVTATSLQFPLEIWKNPQAKGKTKYLPALTAYIFAKPILVWLMEESTFQIDQLPGFRFHPTEEELLGFYLRNTIFDKKISFDIIGFLNIYRHDPKDLPGNALLYFIT